MLKLARLDETAGVNADSNLPFGPTMLMQIRRQTRLRREYLYRKALEDKEKSIHERKRKIKEALDGMWRGWGMTMRWCWIWSFVGCR